ncbi:MAG: SOS response-associated peptidase [Eggerthellaceae bacterium]|nr:SOS response-associated peptidase [Eggerthellaceae bacterium]
MCGKFVAFTYDEIEGVLKALVHNTPMIYEADWPATRTVYPKSSVAVIAPGDGGLEARDLIWGFEPEWSDKVIFNTRLEKALSGTGMWARAMQGGRALACGTGFFEPHREHTHVNPRNGRAVKDQVLFQMANGSPLLMGALAENGRFSIVTTRPNADVAPVHDRMPLVLTPDEARRWLAGDAEGLDDRSDIHLTATPSPGSPSPTQQSLF